ncbi:MAG: DUF4123 domain-containing protein [Tateyamaria sp.]|uniref:hypothetical protein n=1 Tax=Tateyamaria sp. TaxID=1929288 RepID=UPI003280D92E
MIAWVAELDVAEAIPSDDASVRRYACWAAVWAKDKTAAIHHITLFLLVTPYDLVTLKTCGPATEYLANALDTDIDTDIAALAASVSANRLVEFGDLTELRQGAAATQKPPQSLQDAILALDYQSSPVFAVLDGAQFDDLPAALLDGGFSARSLYLNAPESGGQPSLTAPQLVVLNQAERGFTGRSYPETVKALFALIGDASRAVFWQCSAGLDALFFHLRKTNKVLIPKSYLGGHTADLETEENASQAFVALRHADANAMAQIVPAMNVDEASRLFGPCNGVLFAPDPDWAGGRPWIHIARPYTWPAPRPGPLKLCAATMDKIEARRIDRLVNKTVTYLRKVLPANFQHMSLHQLGQSARAARQSGKSLGLKGLAAHNRWAYLCVITEGKIAKSPDVKAFVKHGNGTPDEQVKLAMNETLKTLKAAAKELRA